MTPRPAARLAAEEIDLIVHTGDLLNFPSPGAARHVAGRFRESGVPAVFICGESATVSMDIILDGGRNR
jgi:hypothetical protein